MGASYMCSERTGRWTGLCYTEFSKGGNRGEGLEVVECQQLCKEEAQV